MIPQSIKKGPRNSLSAFSLFSFCSAPVVPASRYTQLRERLVELIPQKQKELKEVSTKYADKSLGEVTVSQVRGF
jgi:hypothetical protein